MRKQLTACLIACLATTSCFVGCGEKSQADQVSEDLESLLDKMSRLQYADAPIEGNKLQYTLGTEVNGVKVPGSTRFEAAYLDQALALLPEAQAIASSGTPLQKESANSIIGSIRIDEASFLIDEAERAFQSGANEVIALRAKLGVLRDIAALNDTVAGDRTEVIETYQTGLQTGGTEITGINKLQDAAEAAAGEADQAAKDLTQYNAEIEKLRDKVAEYEELELKLIGQAHSSQSTEKFDKLDQATTAAKEAETAQAEAQKFEIDAWIAERSANLAEFKRQQLAGDKQSSTTGLLAKLDGFLAESAQETNVSTSSDTYTNLAGILTQAKNASSDDVLKAAAFLLGMSEYGTANAADSDQRQLLVAALDSRINGYLGIIGALEMKIAQIKLDRQRVADKLAEIEKDRQDVLQALSEAFNEKDAMLQAAAFNRMNAALESLAAAETAVMGSGSKNDMELMSVYLIKARALQQQSVSAQLYYTTLSSIVAAGPELIGDTLHATVLDRAEAMQNLLADVKSKVGELQTSASTPAIPLSNMDTGLPRGQVAARQLEVFDSIMTSLGAAPAGIPGSTPSSGDEGTTPPATTGSADPAALVGSWQDEEEGMGLTFKADGKLEMKMSGPGGETLSIEGSYSVDGENLTITMPAEFGGDSETGKFSVSGDTLTLIAPEGEEDEGDVVLKRVN